MEAWASVVPNIDGKVSAGEWDDAASAEILLEYSDLYPETSVHGGTIYVKNDEAYLYLAVVVESDDYHPYDFGVWWFENDNDGIIEVGDDGLSVRGDGYSTDRYRTNAEIEGWWNYDANDVEVRGTDDLVGAASHTNPTGVGDYTFEYKHPLDTDDDAHDFSLEQGDTVGFQFHYIDGGGGSDEWPGLPDYGEIIIASPPTYSLFVRVRDERDNPIEGASVYLDGDLQGETNVEGELNVYDVSGGTHTVLARKEGYLDQEVRTDVTSNMPVRIILRFIEELPDLTVSSLDLSDRRPPEDEEVFVVAVVGNEGNGDAGRFSVSFGVDANEFCSFSFEELGAGESLVLEGTWVAEMVGIHTVSVVVDPTDDVEESFEGNNELTQTIEVIPNTPDLIVRELGFEPLEPRVGEEVQFSITIENVGVAGAPAFNWSLGPCGWESQTRLSGYVSETLDSGARITVHIGFTYAEADRFRAVAVVDPANEIEETSENNNALGETITVAEIEFTFLYGGRIVMTDIPIFGFPDEDDDAINDCWENAATKELNPYFVFDEEEDLYEKQHEHPGHTVVNFVRVTPYPNKTNPEYIVFNMRLTFTKDYGRFGVDSHITDCESLAMAWRVLNENTIRLEWVYTGAHGKHETGHRGVWSPWNERCNTGSICVASWLGREVTGLLIPRVCDWTETEQFCSEVEFYDAARPRLKIQVSEDKHGTYPTCRVCEEVVLIKPSPLGETLPAWLAGFILDSLNGLGQVVVEIFDFLFGWMNLRDEQIGPSQQVLLTYEATPDRPGLAPVHEIHFRGGGAHYILYWHVRNLRNRSVGDTVYRHIRVELDMLHCTEEMDLDGFFSFSDEIYLIVTSFTLHPETDAWSVTDDPVVDQSVDSGDDCTEIFSQPIVVFDGEVTEESLIGFRVTLMEQDSSDPGERRGMVRQARERLLDEIGGVVMEHIGDCDVDLETGFSSWAVAVGEDCGGGRVLQISAYNVGEDLDHLLPSFERLLVGPTQNSKGNLTFFGFDEPIEGVERDGDMKFCAGTDASSCVCDPIVDMLEAIPDLLTDTLDEELGG